MLKDTQLQWDNATLNYDLEKYNWPKWALDVIQEVAPNVTALETIHKELSASEIVKVAAHVQNACSRKDFMQKFDAFVAEYAPPRIGKDVKYMIQRQGTLRVVIPNQAKVGRRLAFHQGVFVGNGRGCRTFWTPFTKATGTNTMWMLDLDISREISRKVLEEKWSLEKFEEVCLEHAWPIELEPGQSHLFFQEHIHGNKNNEEDFTRVAMDMRILLEGEEYGRRNPGGFMRLPGDYEVAETRDYTGKRFITYAGWSSKYSSGIPLPMQRAIMEPYCVKNKIAYTSYEFENEYMDYQPGLEYYINEKPDGIVLCSMYGMTDDKERRLEIFNSAIEKGVELHFAHELTVIRTKEDIEKVETYLNFAVPKKGPQSWEDGWPNNT